MLHEELELLGGRVFLVRHPMRSPRLTGRADPSTEFHRECASAPCLPGHQPVADFISNQELVSPKIERNQPSGGAALPQGSGAALPRGRPSGTGEAGCAKRETSRPCRE